MKFQKNIFIIFLYCAYFNLKAICEDDFTKNKKSTISIKTKSCSCGFDLTMRGRIIGGEEAKKHEFPWQVAMFYKDQYQCGGSIINDRYVLTAAHCFKMQDEEGKGIKTLDKKKLSYLIGAHYLKGGENDTNNKPLVRTPEKIIIHRFYNPFNYYSDIAVVKLDKPIKEYSFNIVPICLPPREDSFVGIEATVSGWGTTSLGGSASNVLMKTKVKIFEPSICKKKLKYTRYDTNVMMCAAKRGHDACQGDSGGPLITRLKDHKYYQIGIVSYGLGCGNYNFPGVYTVVNKFADWLIYHTQDGVYCDS